MAAIEADEQKKGQPTPREQRLRDKTHEALINPIDGISIVDVEVLLDPSFEDVKTIYERYRDNILFFTPITREVVNRLAFSPELNAALNKPSVKSRLRFVSSAELTVRQAAGWQKLFEMLKLEAAHAPTHEKTSKIQKYLPAAVAKLSESAPKAQSVEPKTKKASSEKKKGPLDGVRSFLSKRDRRAVGHVAAREQAEAIVREMNTEQMLAALKEDEIIDKNPKLLEIMYRIAGSKEEFEALMPAEQDYIKLQVQASLTSRGNRVQIIEESLIKIESEKSQQMLTIARGQMKGQLAASKYDAAAGSREYNAALQVELDAASEEARLRAYEIIVNLSVKMAGVRGAISGLLAAGFSGLVMGPVETGAVSGEHWQNLYERYGAKAVGSLLGLTAMVIFQFSKEPASPWWAEAVYAGARILLIGPVVGGVVGGTIQGSFRKKGTEHGTHVAQSAAAAEPPHIPEAEPEPAAEAEKPADHKKAEGENEGEGEKKEHKEEKHDDPAHKPAEASHKQ